MNENHPPGDRFEDRLLEELKNVVAQKGAEETTPPETTMSSPAWRRAPRLAAGAVAVCAAAGAVLVLSSGSGGTAKAFAVEPQSGGGVTISVYSAEDADGLERALGEAGIESEVNWLPNGMECRQPRFTPSTVKTDLGGTIGGLRVGGPGKALRIAIMSPEQLRELHREYAAGEISEDRYDEASGNIALDPASFSAGQSVVISGSRGPYGGDPEGGYEAEVAIAQGPVAPCEVTPVPENSSLREMSRVLESEAGEK